MTKFNKRFKLFLTFIITLSFLSPIPGYSPIAAQEEAKQGAQEPTVPEFVPGQLIIKLREGKTLEDVADLNQKYGITASERVIPDTPSPQQTLDDLKAKYNALGNPSHDSWYWQLDKNSKEYKDYIAKLEKEKEELQGKINAQEELVAKLEARQKRAPEGTEAPKLDNIYLLKVNKEANIPQMAAEYSSNANVEYAEPDYIVKVQMVPNDPYYSSKGTWGQDYDDLWGLKKIHADKAWDISQGEGVIVAVVDTGIDYNHEDISTNVWVNTREIPNNGKDDDNNGYIDDIKGWDFAYGDSNPMDGFGHGTHVAGTIAALGNNQKGVIGVAPKAKVMAVKGLDDTGDGDIARLANCIKYAADNGADVLNNSWGGGGTSSLIDDALRYAYDKGCVIVASAGNSNDDAVNYFPASSSLVITVASTDHNDEKSDFSNWGKIDIVAPGGDSQDQSSNNEFENILSLRAVNTDIYGDGDNIVNTKYYRARGTSMAAPHVSGAIALILKLHPTFTSEQVRQVLIQSADTSIVSDKFIGFGRLNVYSALQKTNVSNGSAAIISPITGSYVSQHFNKYLAIQCTMSGSSYMLEYSKASYPLNWITINSGNSLSISASWYIADLAEGDYVVRLTAVDSQGTIIKNAVVSVEPAMYWKARSQKSYIGPLTVADLDGDGDSEILFVSVPWGWGDAVGNYVFALHHDGSPVQGWPVQIPYPEDGQSPAVGDVNKDGKPEVVLGVGNCLYIWDCNGKVLLYKQISTTDHIYSTPVLADLNKDGNLEIIIGTGAFANWEPIVDPKVYVLDYQGNSLPGWPKALETGGSVAFSIPAVGDLDKDGDLEIVLTTTDNIKGNQNNSSVWGGKIYAWHHTGESLSGWPIHVDGFMGDGATSALLVDLDHDGDLEILAGAYGGYRKISSQLYCWHHNGQLCSGWPIPSKSTIDGLSVGDINADNEIEILFTDRGTSCSYVVDKNGRLLQQWSLLPEFIASSAAIGDINSDGAQEIVAGSWRGKLFALHYNGEIITGYPKNLEGAIYSPPAICDVDNNGKTDVIASEMDTGTIHIFFDQGSYVPGKIQWPMFRHDRQHTGSLVTVPYQASITITSSDSAVTLGAPIHISARVTNQGSLTWTTDVFHLRAHAYLPDGTYLQDVNTNGATLPSNVASGQSVTMNLTLPTGAATQLKQIGTYRIIVDMVHEGVRWFGNGVEVKAGVK